MAITASLLTEDKSTTSASSYTTASVTPASNALIVVTACGGTTGVPPTVSSVSGCGITWTKLASAVGANHVGVTVYTGLSASPTAGAITITFPSAVSNCLWHVAQYTQVNTVTPISQSATGQNVGGSSTLLATLGTMPLSTSVVVGSCVANTTTATLSVGSGFSVLGTDAQAGSPSNQILVETDTTPTGTEVTATLPNNFNWAIVGYEIPLGTTTLSPTGIATGAALGSPTVNLKVQPSGFMDPEAFGSPVITQLPGTVLRLIGIPSGIAFGTTAVSEGTPAQSASLFSFAGATQATSRTPTSALIVPMPIAPLASLALAFIVISGEAAISTPSGWTFLAEAATGMTSTDCQLAAYFKAVSGEPPGYAWNFTTYAAAAGVILVYTGAATTVPVVASTSGGGALVTAPPISSPVANSIVVHAFGLNPNVVGALSFATPTKNVPRMSADPGPGNIPTRAVLTVHDEGQSIITVNTQVQGAPGTTPARVCVVNDGGPNVGMSVLVTAGGVLPQTLIIGPTV